MLRRLIHLLAVSGIVVCVHPVFAQADQNDPRLDTLFGSLQQANTMAEAMTYVAETWEVWTEHDDPLLNDRMAKGVKAMGDGDYVVAIGIFTNIIEADPEFAEGWNKRATVYYLLGKIEESQSDVTETLLLEPRHFGALSGRGLLYSATGDLHKALRAFEEALAINPFMPSAQDNVDALRDAIDQQEI